MKIKPIILSGGSGKRLWPLSTENKPKQFFDIFNKKINLFEETLNRTKNLNFARPIIISNKNQRFNILKSIRNCNTKYDKVLLEDSPKNTAPAFAASTFFCKDEEVLCFLPSDHYIQNNAKFINALLKAKKIALDNKLVILGLKSKEPNVNYGYIKYKKNYIYKDSFEVDSFIEKPKKSKALKLCKIGALWNSGIVIVKNSYLKSGYLEKTIPQINTILNLLSKKKIKGNNLYISLRDSYNLNSKIHPKKNSKIFAYSEPVLALLGSFRFDEKELVKSYHKNRVKIKEKKNGILKKLKKKRFLYLVDTKTFIPHEKGNNVKFFSQAPVVIKDKEQIDNVYDIFNDISVIE